MDCSDSIKHPWMAPAAVNQLPGFSHFPLLCQWHTTQSPPQAGNSPVLFPRPALGIKVGVNPFPGVLRCQHQRLAVVDVYHALITGGGDDHESIAVVLIQVAMN